MELTKTEQKAIAAGAKQVVREERPTVDRGQRIVVLWSEPRNAALEEDKATNAPAERWSIPAEPLLVVIVRRVIRQLHGWQIRFDVEDYRPEKGIYLARHSGFTTDRGKSPDKEASVLDPETLKTVDLNRRVQRAERTKTSELAQRNQELAARQFLHEGLRDLDAAGQEAFLAWFKREGEKKLSDLKEAA